MLLLFEQMKCFELKSQIVICGVFFFSGGGEKAVVFIFFLPSHIFFKPYCSKYCTVSVVDLTSRNMGFSATQDLSENVFGV